MLVEYRHILHGPYRTLYRVDGDRVIIVRVVHGAQLLDRSVIEGPGRRFES